MSLRRFLATSDSRAARTVRAIRKWTLNLSIPAPKVIFRPLLYSLLAVRNIWWFIRRVFYAEPLFKAYCTRYGKGLHTDIYLHWIQGKGDIILGHNVKFDGKTSITFASRYCDRPTLKVGNNTGISSGCTFVIGKEIVIGNNCRIAGGTSIFDSSGHASDPELRLSGATPTESEVRPVTIEDNVWLGKRVTVFPGTVIGEGSIVSAGSVVMSNVARYTVVAGNPARKIGSLTPPASSDARKGSSKESQVLQKEEVLDSCECAG
jgi:acetyltransferase-like isoleucine patch superfamily enzyme